MIVTAPWTLEEVAALNDYQQNGRFHPFTCGNDRSDDVHVAYAALHRDRDLGLLVATAGGWHCPVCGYFQNWAHDFMAIPAGGMTGPAFCQIGQVSKSRSNAGRKA
jgi:hypothetical protein